MQAFLKTSFLASLLLLLFIQLKSQDKKDVKFYDSITEDSVLMFFNELYTFTEPECAKYMRYTKIDKSGNFFEAFTDSSVTNIVARGYYRNGVKDGYFELFYPNGNMKCKGNYKNNLADGEWNFFYENGRPERTLLCSETAILLTGFIDKEGNILVKDGNGLFNGRVMANGGNNSNIIAWGNIVNGMPDGKWNSLFLNRPYTEELFDKGKFIAGNMTSLTSKNNKYSNRSFLNTFFITNYLDQLERFNIQACLKNTITSNEPFKQESYSFDMATFRSYVRDEVDRVYSNDAKRNQDEYQPGENTLSIVFSVNDKGIPEKFRRVSSWGDPYVEPMIRIITRYAKFPPNTAKYYFHMVFTIGEGFTFSYKFHFSRNQSAYQ